MQVRAHMNVVVSLDTVLLSQTTLHGVLGQTTPDKAPNVATLPPQLQACCLSSSR
jgi:hypothetical protein